jgi:hypothetical protein
MPSTKRKFGIEMEGYIRRHPRNMRLPHGADVKRDASLRNNGWDNALLTEFGVEIVSKPTKDTSHVADIFSEMRRNDWHVDTAAGTHVHIDIADYTGFDKAKLLRFCKGIERIIFMFVKNYRNNNRYCKNLSNDWRKIFKPVNKKRRNLQDRWVIDKAKINLEDVSSGNLMSAIRNHGLTVENSKYFWLNIYGSRHGTAEFRIFHAVENMEEIENFILMAHNIVELAKNSTPEQLEFIILSLYESENIFRLRDNFLQLLNMTGREVPMKGGEARQYMEKKLAEKHPIVRESFVGNMPGSREEKLTALMRKTGMGRRMI